MDSLLWRIEADPVLRSPVLVVCLLDRTPTAQGVEATVRRAAGTLPRLRQRIAPPPLGVGRPRWEDDPSPVGGHVRHVRAPGHDLDAVLELAAPDAAAAFDPARSPWTLTVVDDLDGGRAAVVLRFHHALTDGVGGMALAARLFDHAREPDGDGPSPTPAPEPAAAPPGPRPQGPSGAPGGGVRTVRRLLGTAAHPVATVASLARLGTSTARMLAPAPPGSPELTGRSLDRRLSVTEVPLAAVRCAASAAGGTVNDVLLGAVAGALATYHRTRGHPVAAVRVTMPVSVRRAGDEEGGNRFAPVRFTLPVDDPDPAMRVRIAGAIARSRRSEPAVGATDVLAAGLDLLPRPAVSRLFAGMLRAIDVDVSDVPGLRRPAYLGGARIERLWAFAPPAGAALSVTLVSHERTCCIGLACDRRAVAEPELLSACLDEAVAEVLRIGRSDG